MTSYSLFGNKYICDKTFSIMIIDKQKLSDNLLQAVLRIHSTDIQAKFNDIIKIKQLHKSHNTNE